MRNRHVLLVAVFALMVMQLPAEDVRSTNVRVYSENMRFFANISKKTSNVVEVQLFEKDHAYESWSHWVEWDKSAIEMVTNDGKYFILLNNDYSDANSLVTIYSRLKQEAYTVRSIRIEREYLVNDSGKFRWIGDETKDINIKYGENDKATAMEIKIIDGRILSIDLN